MPTPFLASPTDALRIVLLDTKSKTPNHYICLSVAAALRRNSLVEEVIEVDYGNALALAKAHRANFFLAYDGEGLNTEICRRLRERCGFAALWITDDPYELRYNLASAQHFDVVFTNDRSSASAYGKIGHFLPFGADPERAMSPRLEGDAALRYDIFFAGVAWPNRVKMLRSLLRDLPELRFKIALVGNEHLPPFDLPLERSAYAYRTSATDFARLANASRVVLGLTRDFAASSIAEPQSSSPPPRIFEAAIAGTAQIAGADLPRIGDFFTPGTEIAIFETYRRCVELIRELCHDAPRRNAIATAAHARVLEDHTFDRRVDELLRVCKQIPVRRKGLASKLTATRRPSVLMVAHNVLGAAPFGGIEIYLDRLRRWLAKDFDVLTFSYDPASGKNAFALTDARGSVIDRVAFDGAWQAFSLTNTLKEQYFADLLVRREIDLVHFHHLIGHPLSLPIIGHALGIPALWTLHDFDGVCDSFNLLDYDHRYCEIDRRDERVCDYCTNRRVGLPLDAQRSRRALVRRSLDSVDRILVSSDSTRALYARFFPRLDDSKYVTILPVPMPERVEKPGLGGRPLRRIDGFDADLNVVVLGNVTREKGAEVILAAAQALSGEPVTFRFYGRVDPDIRTLIASRSLANVVVQGAYAPADLPAILATADATLHASIWPETYCIALSEAWAHGRVPIVSDIGALGERVTDRGDGLKIQPNDVADLVRVIRELIDDSRILLDCEGRIDPARWPQAVEHAAKISEIYRDLIDANGMDVRTPGGTVSRTSLTLFDCNVALSEGAQALSRPHRDARSFLPLHREPFMRDRETTSDFEALPSRKTPAGSPRLHAHVDEIDGIAADTIETVDKRQNEILAVRGWRVDRNVANPLGKPRVALVDASERPAYVAEARAERRTDVFTAYRSDSVVWSGFECVASLRAVAPGTYRIAVVDDGRESPLMPIVIRILTHTENDDAFAGLDGGAPLAAAATQIGEIEPASANEAITVQMTLSVRGWCDTTSGSCWLAIESSTDGERHYAALGDRGRNRDFAIDVDVRAFDSGEYNLSVAAVEDGKLRTTSSLARINVRRPL